jgi:serine/threonine-protein kinase
MSMVERERNVRPPPLPGKMPEKFGRYLLVSRIGSGGMADVFRAVSFGFEGFRRIIVVKRIRRELTDSPEFLQMFFDEAKISALLHHPNIVQVYDFGQVQGEYFLAMEHLEGRDGATMLRALRSAQSAFAPSLAAFVGREVALGLHYAHTLRSADNRSFDIIHRDINPSNIMLLRTGGVKILDFGIAKASEAAGKVQTQHGLVKGKFSYLSPEQAHGRPLDARSDLFSWGASMWEMLVGNRLFAGKTDFERLSAVKHGTIPPPSRRRPQIPRELDRIVLRALERDLERRYQSAEELAADLEEFLRGAPADPEGVRQLIVDHFGEESGRNLAVSGVVDPLFASSDSSPVVTGSGSDPVQRAATPTAMPIDPSDEMLTEIDQGMAAALLPSTAEIAGESPARSGALLWAGAGVLLVLAVAVVSWALRAPPGASAALTVPTVTSLTDPVPRRAAPAGAPAAAGLVRIEVNSEPAGAVVSGAGGLLGTTPLTVSLPASTEVETLRFEKPGYAPATYEVRPQSAGVVFVELRRAPP